MEKTKLKISKLNTIVIHVKDVEKSAHFYGDVLGLEKGPVEQDMAWFSVGSRENAVPILLHYSPLPQPTNAAISIDFEVEDVEEAVSIIEEAGYKVTQGPIVQEWGVKEAIVTDPDGHKIWLVEHLQ